jgi:polyphosphate kinase
VLARAIDESLNNYLADNTQAWVLQPDGTYKRLSHGAHKQRNAQQTLLQEYCS